MSKIIFKTTHPFIRRWAVPELFGTGKVAHKIRQETKLSKKLVKTPLPGLSPPFAFWHRTKYEVSPNLNTKRFNVDLYDGGVVGIDKVFRGDTPSNSGSDQIKPIVLLFPGGNETTYSTKVQTLCSSYLDAGYDDVFMCNYRGRCNTNFKTPRFTAPFGDFNEVHALVEYINQHYAGRQILLTGDCFGGFCIVDYLTNWKQKPVADNVVGGVVHSVQWNVEAANKKLYVEPYFSMFVKPYVKYNRDLLIHGKKGNEEFAQMVYEKIGPQNFERLSMLSIDTPDNVKELYGIALTHLFDGEYKSEYEYICKTSPHKKLEASTLAKPLVVVNAADDPTAPISQQDIDGMENDPNMCFWLFAAGGHCAYLKHFYPVTNFIDETMVECADVLVNNFSN